MTGIKRTDFVSTYGKEHHIDTESLKSKAPVALQGSVQELATGADLNKDGKIAGRAEMERLFEGLSKFEASTVTNDSTPDYVEINKGGGVTRAGTLFQLLMSEMKRDSLSYKEARKAQPFRVGIEGLGAGFSRSLFFTCDMI